MNVAADKASKCLYLYGIADTRTRLRLGNIGIGGAQVYAIPCQELSAIVHDCQPRPYDSEDGQVLERWVRTHENVVDVATEKLGNVIPLRFDTIIKPDGHTTSRAALKRWISKESRDLRNKMEKIRGKREYGVQVFYEPFSITEKIVQKNAEVAKVMKSVDSSSGGLAYVQKLKFENMTRKKLEATVASHYRDFYERIRQEVDEVKVGRVKKALDGRAMLMNLSLLANDEEAHALGSSLDRIEKEGFSVRFTGPWPPYSFV